MDQTVGEMGAEMGAEVGGQEERSRPESSGWRRAGLLSLGVLGMALASGSVSRLQARVEQLERQAAESEARVAELQLLRDGMTRRLRQMEEQLKPAAPPPTSRQAPKRPASPH